MLRIDCWEAEKDLKTTPGSDCALNALAIDEPLEYVRLYLDGTMQMWVDAEDSLELWCFFSTTLRLLFSISFIENSHFTVHIYSISFYLL